MLHHPGLTQRDGAFAPYKRFYRAKTLAQVQFISAEHVKYNQVEPPKAADPKKEAPAKPMLLFWGPSGDSTRALKNSPPDCFCRPAGRRAVRIQLFMQKSTAQPGVRVGRLISGDPAGIRTPDTLLKRQVLCQLSYWVKTIYCKLVRIIWLGWPDSNQRMRESKSRALPLGDTPL